MSRPRNVIDTTTYTGRFAARIKVLREIAGQTVEELAEHSGIPASTIYDWEKGRTAPKIDRFPELAEALGIEIRLLLPEE